MGVDVDSLSPEERPMSFVKALRQLQKNCRVDELKMSSYEIQQEEIPMLAKNARHTMGGLFEVDPYKLSLEETILIMANAYK